MRLTGYLFLKIFSYFFSAFPISTKNSEYFEKKDEDQKQCLNLHDSIFAIFFDDSARKILF